MSLSKVRKNMKKKQQQRPFHFVNYMDGHGSKFKGSNREMRKHVMLDVLQRTSDAEKQKGFPTALEDGPQIATHDLDRGRRLDDFNVLPKSYSSVDIEHLKQNCISFFGCEGMSHYWSARALQDDLFFKSSLCVTAAHEDALCNRQDAPSTLALETDVVGLLMSRYSTLKHESPTALVESVLNVASAGNYSPHERDSVVYSHYNELESICSSNGDFLEASDKHDLPKLILVNALIFAATREREPHPSFLATARKLNAQTNYIPQERFQSFINPGQYHESSGLNGRSWLRMELLQTMKSLVDSLLSKQPDANYYALKTSIRQRFQALPGAAEPNHDSFCDHVYESCRLAVWILEEAAFTGRSLSDCATNTNVTSMLQASLVKADVDRLRADLGSILLWILLIGAAGARFSNERTWFIAQLMKTAIIRSFSHGEAVITALCRFLEVQHALVHSVPWGTQ